jgi:hypothetical protein
MMKRVRTKKGSVCNMVMMKARLMMNPSTRIVPKTRARGFKRNYQGWDELFQNAGIRDRSGRGYQQACKYFV